MQCRRFAIPQKILAEASGGINLQTVRAAAESGVDIVSVGALTHSARALDIALTLKFAHEHSCHRPASKALSRAPVHQR
jgi:nicotinate-nucleotide pyrophosphorylase